MTYTRRNKGVCSRSTTVVLDDDGRIARVEVDDGCDGNLQAVCTLLAGLRPEDAIPKLAGIRCEDKSTSCPAQIAACLAEAAEAYKNQG